MNSKTRRQVIALAGLTLVMAAVYARPLFRPSASHRRPARSPLEGAAPPAAARPAPEAAASLDLPAESPARRAQRQHANELAWGRDPFTGGASGGQVSGFDLSGILWDATQPIAVINGEMRHVGDEVDGYRIVAITEETVSISDGTQDMTLSLHQ